MAEESVAESEALKHTAEPISQPASNLQAATKLAASAKAPTRENKSPAKSTVDQSHRTQPTAKRSDVKTEKSTKAILQKGAEDRNINSKKSDLLETIDADANADEQYEQSDVEPSLFDEELQDAALLEDSAVFASDSQDMTISSQHHLSGEAKSASLGADESMLHSSVHSEVEQRSPGQPEVPSLPASPLLQSLAASKVELAVPVVQKQFVESCDHENVRSALARALSREDVVSANRSPGSHQPSAPPFTPPPALAPNVQTKNVSVCLSARSCANCEDLRKDLEALQRNVLQMEEALHRSRAHARNSATSPMTVASHASLDPVDMGSLYEFDAHEPPYDKGVISLQDDENLVGDVHEVRSAGAQHLPVLVASPAVKQGNGTSLGHNTGGGKEVLRADPLAPVRGSALESLTPTHAGNTSVISTGYATMDKEVKQPVVSYRDISGQEYSMGRLGIEGAQGSLDLMSEYGLDRADDDGAETGPDFIKSSPRFATQTTTNSGIEAALAMALSEDHSYQRVNELDSSTLNRTDRKRLNLLQEDHAKSLKEAADKIKSLEFQNVELADKLRAKIHEKQHAEKLHSLQLMERGVLLKELARQVTELKASLTLEKKKSAPAPKSPTHRGGLPIPDVNARKTKAEESARAKTPVVLAQGKVVDSIQERNDSDFVKDSFSRMLAASASMPILSDEYGTFRAAGTLNSRASSREAADTGFQTSGRIASPHNTSRGKTISSGKLNFLPDILNNADVRVDKSLEVLRDFAVNPQTRLGVTSDIPTPKLTELTNVRQQIVSMLSERYPQPTAEQMLAVKKAKDRALYEREMELKAEADRKKAAAEQRAAVRARAKPKRVRPDEDDW